jgi:hypothetical protein
MSRRFLRSVGVQPVEVMNPRGLVRQQPESVSILTDIGRGLEVARLGPEQADAPVVRLAGPFHSAEDSKFGHRWPVVLGTQRGILQIEAKTAKETSACGLVVGFDAPVADEYAFPFARIMWGVAGGSDILECDLLPGGIPLNMPATGVRVDVFHPIMDPGIVGALVGAPSIDAFAFLDVHGGLCRPGTSNPLRRTIYVTQIVGGGGTDLIPIPRYSVAFQLGGRNVGFPGQLANVQAQQSASSQTFVPLFMTQGINSPSNVVGGAIPIAGGARGLRILNNDALPIDPVVIFYLSL